MPEHGGDERGDHHHEGGAEQACIGVAPAVAALRLQHRQARRDLRREELGEAAARRLAFGHPVSSSSRPVMAITSAGLRPASRRARRASASLRLARRWPRSEEQTSELQSLMRNSDAVFCLKKKKN